MPTPPARDVQVARDVAVAGGFKHRAGGMGHAYRTFRFEESRVVLVAWCGDEQDASAVRAVGAFLCQRCADLQGNRGRGVDVPAT